MAPGNQTAQYPSQPSKPESTKELVSRLTSAETQEKEKIALQALTKAMIETFADNFLPSYLPEACELASVAGNDYSLLLRTFQNAISQGSSDKTSLPPELPMTFSSVLQRANGKEKEKIRKEIQLGPVAVGLHRRLEAAVIQAEYQTAYELVQALSSVLDTMNVIKTSGLGREALHGPLLKQLFTLRKHQEPRLAQAADYAHQALLGIPNDESPLGEFWRYFRAISTPIATFAGAASTMDPAKFLIAFEKLEELKEVIDTMVRAVKALSDAYSGVRGAFKDGHFLQTQRSWYLALRYTDLLIRAEAFIDLKEFVNRVPCSQQKEFLCGLYAQLEQAWTIVPSPPTKLKIVDFLQDFLVPKGSETDDELVQEWIKIVADTIGRPDWKNGIKPHEHRWQLRKRKKYVPKIAISESRNEALAAKLLEKAWEDCSEAKVFYADACILQHYTTGPRLQIERISGRLLPMDRCFINLAILEQAEKEVGGSGKQYSADQPSQFTLATRLNVQEPDKEAQITLPDLFNPRQWDDGRSESPRRILIHGRAGVGKTTLCKKMVYDFAREGMWHGLYERILWVPLRNLKPRHGTGYNLERLFYDEYFALKGENIGFAFAKALCKKVSTDGDKTLFILDGLDEVYNELGQENEMSRFLNDLLAQSRVIITSRPHANLPQGLDTTNLNNRYLKLETVGFFPDQVSAYIRSAFTDPKTGTIDAEKSDKVQSFLHGRSLVQSLFRIPIQLDLLCYTWDQNSHNKPPSTMTRLYESLELRLWQKDLSRKGQGTKDSLWRTNRQGMEKENLAGPYIPVLEALAFSGLHSNTQEFTCTHREDIYREFNLAVTDPEVEELSFLRTSDVLSEQLNRDYHFLHLTFQEYFAARYLVRQWIAGQDLICLDLTKSDARGERITAARFIEKEKYNPSYDILWRFVTGLLLSGRHERELCEFFQIIEAEPRDLLGPVHQRLVMHCLSEAVADDGFSNFTNTRRELERQLSQWMLSECENEGYSPLVREMEFPEQILEEVLNSASEDTKATLLRSLHTSLNIPPQIKKLAALWIQDAGSAGLKVAALGIFQPPNEAPPDVLAAAADQLHYHDSRVKFAAVQVLCRRSTLSEYTLNYLEENLKDPESQLSAFEVLSGRVKLSREILQKVGGKLKSSYIRLPVLEVLGYSSSVPGEIIQNLAGQPREADAPLAITATEALYGQSNLSVEVLQALAKLLQHFGPEVKVAVVGALASQSTLSEELLLKLVDLLRDSDSEVGDAAARILSKQPIFSEEILNAIEGQLEDPDLRVKTATLEALLGQCPLSKGILHSLEHLARSSEPEIMHLAFRTLIQRSALSEKLFQYLVNLSMSSEYSLKVTAIQVLGELSTLPEKVIDVLGKAVGDPKSDIRSVAINSLRGKSDLPQDILKALEKQLDDPQLQMDAAATLHDQSTLPPELLQDLARHLPHTKLHDFNPLVVTIVVKTLGKAPDLPEQILKDLAENLTHSDWDIRSDVVQALARQATLPKKLLIALAETLADDSEHVRNDAVPALDQHMLRHAEDVYSVLSSIDERCLNSYFAAWRRESFYEHRYCYIKDEKLHVVTPQGSASNSLDFSQQEQLRKLSKLLPRAKPQIPNPSTGPT